MKTLKVLNFQTLQAYEDIWKLQKELVERRIRDEITDHLLLLEHEHVITTGRHADFSNLKQSEEEIKNLGIALFKIERGGDITYHGPGQLVGYPILKIKKPLIGIKEFIKKLEKALQHTIASYGIETYLDDKYIGVWHEKGKIVAIGTAFKKWVSYHGFAFNVNTDMSYFKLINPCGLEEKGVVSLSQLLGRYVSIEEVKERFIENFKKQFGYTEILKNRKRNFKKLKIELSKIVSSGLNFYNKIDRVVELLHREVSYYDWVGFYIAVPEKRLKLGPYKGEPTEHVEIPFGKGICGQVAESLETFIVPDVLKEKNYLACSVHVKSEIVVPIFSKSRFVAEIDIDAHVKNAFDEEDQAFLEWLAKEIGERWEEDTVLKKLREL